MSIAVGEQAVVAGTEREQRQDETDEPGDREDECDAPVGTGAEPPADQLDTGPGGHERYEDELRDGANEEGRQRRGGQLDALRKAEDASLPFEGHHLLQDGVLRRLDVRHDAEEDEHPHRQQEQSTIAV